MKNKWANTFEKLLHILWVAVNLIFFTWTGYWYVGVLLILCFYLLYGLIRWLTGGSQPEKKSYDERQKQMVNNSYKWGIIVGLALLYGMPSFFSDTDSFAFFIIGIVGSVVTVYQIMTGSLFGYNTSKKEIYAALTVLLFIGAGGTFLYCRDMVIGTQKLFAVGKFAIHSGFWLVLASLVISISGWFHLFKERRI